MALFGQLIRTVRLPGTLYDIVYKRVTIFNEYWNTTIFYCLKSTSKILWWRIFLCTDVQTWSIDVLIVCKSLTTRRLMNYEHRQMTYTIGWIIRDKNTLLIFCITILRQQWTARRETWVYFIKFIFLSYMRIIIIMTSKSWHFNRHVNVR